MADKNEFVSFKVGEKYFRVSKTELERLRRVVLPDGRVFNVTLKKDGHATTHSVLVMQIPLGDQQKLAWYVNGVAAEEICPPTPTSSPETSFK